MKSIKNILFITILSICIGTLVVSCESSEDISRSFDHEVPLCAELTDSIVGVAGGKVNFRVLLKDDSGIGSIEFLYGNWYIREFKVFEGNDIQKEYVFETEINIPEDAKKEYYEDVMLNDGTVLKNQLQTYHKLDLIVIDAKKNKLVRKVYIKVQ